MEMIEYGKKAGLSVSLLTNGTRLTPEYTEKLIELGLDRIVFSFDAIDKETYEAVRVKSEFQSTLKKMYSISLRETMKQAEKHLYVHLWFFF